MTRAYPLQWPAGWPRTDNPGPSKFKVSQEQAQQDVLRQLDLMGAGNIVISTNIPIRKDGLPYAKHPQVHDVGVAVYFQRKGMALVIPCDRWWTIAENMRAIGLTIEAIRGLERWGAKQTVDTAFAGFAALPAPKAPWDILGVDQHATEAEIKAAHTAAAKRAHPDVGGDDAQMAEINRARDEMLARLRDGRP